MLTRASSRLLRPRWARAARTDARDEEIGRVFSLISAYKREGHLVADLDPLRLHAARAPEFEDSQLPFLGDHHGLGFGFGEEDLERRFFIGDEVTSDLGPVATLRDLVATLKKMFAGTLATEYMHLLDRDAMVWLRGALEQRLLRDEPARSLADRMRVFEALTRAERFEHYLGARFSGAKRFSIEGAEALVPALQALLKRSAELGVTQVHLGMAHRARLNVLANVLQLKPHVLLSEMEEYLPDLPHLPNNSNDVRYHLGLSRDVHLPGGHTLAVHLESNPSHLEANNAVVLGNARAAAWHAAMEARSTVERELTGILPVLIHGDAAMFLGSVREALGFSALADFGTGGCVHVVVNNRIGFTTLPAQADSSVHCTDVARLSRSPVLHVNADDPDAVVHAFEMAAEFRAAFARDVVIDLVCYRRHGHNEQDSPEITAPRQYNLIADHPTVTQIYRRKLEALGADPALLQAARDEFDAHLRGEAALAAGARSPAEQWPVPSWHAEWVGDASASDSARGLARQADGAGVVTGVRAEDLQALGRLMYDDLPDDFHLHFKVAALYNDRLRAIEAGRRVNWRSAEALAFATLARDGVPVRLSGQDVERGTFGQRHAVAYDSRAPDPPMPAALTPVHRVAPADFFQVVNSPLSELSVLAFEYGYNLFTTARTERSLVLWEAQFGDFANGAQVIIDTYLACGEQKWLNRSNLVLLLPHGYEGQGPDHSSAKIERFLQLANEDPWPGTRRVINLNIAQPTTAAQYFHLLRRQALRATAKPLVVFSPKSLLHHRPAQSDLADFAPDRAFQPVQDMPADEPAAADRDVRRVVFCTGKLGWHLIVKRRARELAADVVVVRIEELVPFPFDEVERRVRRYPNAEVVWAQEEPRNMGAWTFCQPRLRRFAPQVRFIGRPTAASPATGKYAQHVHETKELVEEALAR